jgi:Zn-dependent protease
MLLRYFSVLGDAPLAFVILVGAFAVSMVVGLAFHEFMHAYVADRLGDGTPRRFGRLTLDPRAHLDPLGSTLIFFIGFGWAKPVPVNPANTANPKSAMAMIAAAGPLTNLAVAGLAGIPIQLGWVPALHPFVGSGLAEPLARFATDSPENLIGLFLGTIVLLNVLLAVFNLLPLAPLDGFRVAVGLLPRELARPLAEAERWGPGVLMLLIFAPFLTGGEINPLFTVLGPPIDVLLGLLAPGINQLRFG